MADNKNGINNTAENVSSGKRLPPAAARAKKAAEERAKATEEVEVPVVEPEKVETEVVELPKIDEPVQVTDPIPNEELIQEESVQVIEPTEVSVCEEPQANTTEEVTPVEAATTEETLEAPKPERTKVKVVYENGKLTESYELLV